MSLIRAILLGVVQGITSVFPVSSSGHIRLFTNILGVQTGAGLPMMALLHLGTLIAVVAVFYRDIVRLGLAVAAILRDAVFNARLLFGGKKRREGKSYRRVLDGAYRRFALLLLVSLVPTFVLGRVLAALVRRSEGMLLATAIGFFVTALLLMVSSFFGSANKGPRRAGLPDALIIGIFQGASVFPGISRLGMVLASANLCGFSRKFAIKFAYIMSIPTILGALATELPGAGAELSAGLGVPGFILGVAVAAILAAVLIHIAVRILKRRPDRAFAIYCAALGVASVVVYILGRR